MYYLFDNYVLSTSQLLEAVWPMKLVTRLVFEFCFASLKAHSRTDWSNLTPLSHRFWSFLVWRYPLWRNLEIQNFFALGPLGGFFKFWRFWHTSNFWMIISWHLQMIEGWFISFSLLLFLFVSSIFFFSLGFRSGFASIGFFFSLCVLKSHRMYGEND